MKFCSKQEVGGCLSVPRFILGENLFNSRAVNNCLEFKSVPDGSDVNETFLVLGES